MTFLELAKKLRQKCGVAGTGPTTVVSQSGELGDLVDWINEAWLLIQAEEPNWRWMRRDVSFQTQAGKLSYLPTVTAGEVGIANFSAWFDDDSWRCYKTALGRTDESWLVWWPYQQWRDTYDFGTQSTKQSKPQIIATRDQDQALLLAEVPDAIYTVTGQYWSSPVSLAVDADVPGCPSRFHMAIVYRAMMLYGKYEGAPEVYADGKEEFEKLYAALRIDQLEQIHLGAPLA
jgi:hypothetical protein